MVCVICCILVLLESLIHLLIIPIIIPINSILLPFVLLFSIFSQSLNAHHTLLIYTAAL